MESFPQGTLSRPGKLPAADDLGPTILTNWRNPAVCTAQGGRSLQDRRGGRGGVVPPLPTPSGELGVKTNTRPAVRASVEKNKTPACGSPGGPEAQAGPAVPHASLQYMPWLCTAAGQPDPSLSARSAFREGDSATRVELPETSKQKNENKLEELEVARASSPTPSAAKIRSCTHSHSQLPTSLPRNPARTGRAAL